MNQIIGNIVTTLLSLLNKETFKKVIDAMLDKIEESVHDSDNKIDDAIVLPLTRKARELLDVPDDDEIN